MHQRIANELTLVFTQSSQDYTSIKQFTAHHPRLELFCKQIKLLRQTTPSADAAERSTDRLDHLQKATHFVHIAIELISPSSKQYFRMHIPGLSHRRE